MQQRAITLENSPEAAGNRSPPAVCNAAILFWPVVSFLVLIFPLLPLSPSPSASQLIGLLIVYAWVGSSSLVLFSALYFFDVLRVKRQEEEVRRTPSVRAICACAPHDVETRLL